LSKKIKKLQLADSFFVCAVYIPRLLKITDYFFARLLIYQIFSPGF